MRHRLKVLSILSSLFLFFISFTYTQAATSINIETTKASINALEEFSVTITGSSLKNNVAYYVKGVGGDSNYDIQTKASNGNWLNWNSSWSEMPTSTTNSEGTMSATLNVRYKDNTSTGSKTLLVRVHEVATGESAESNTLNISVTALPPTPTPTATPTSTPTSTPTPTPTVTPKPSPKVTTTPKPSPTPTSSPQTLGLLSSAPPGEYSFENTPTPTPESESQLGGKPIAAAALMGTGILFMGLAAVPFLKKRSSSYN